MTSKYYYYFSFVFIGLIISLLLNQDRIIRSFYNDEQRHAVPIASNKIDLGDDYHYYVQANNSFKHGFTEKDKIYSTNNMLFGALFTSGFINFLCQKIVASSDTAVLLSLIVQALLLVLATLYLIKTLSKGEGAQAIGSLGFWAFLALVISEFFLLNSYIGQLHKQPLLSYYPNILRLVNPQLAWAYGLVYLGLMYQYLEKGSLLKFTSLCVLSVLFSLFSFALCLTMMLAMSLLIGMELISKRKIDYYLVVLLFLLLISFLFNYAQLHYFQLSPKGQEVNTGGMIVLVFRWHYLLFLTLIGPILIYYKGRQRLFLCSILIASLFIGAFCETLHLGGRLWIRGAGFYVLILATVLLSNWLGSIIKNRTIPALGFLVLAMCTYFLLPHNFIKDHGYIDTNKWVMLDWINHNVPPNSIIMSDDLEFSFLLPLYTQAQPFVPLFSLTSYSTEEIVKKYYFTLEQLGGKDETLMQLKTFTHKKYVEYTAIVRQQKALDDLSFKLNAFYNGLIYYPFTQFTRQIFTSDATRQNFFATLERWSKEKPQGRQNYDYVLSSNNSLNKHPIFRTNNYSLYLKK